MRGRRPRIYREFSSGADSGAEYLETYEPVRPYSLEHNVIVPMAIGLGLGLFLAPIIAGLTYWRWPGLPWAIVGVGTFFVVGAATFVRKVGTAEDLCWLVKRALHSPEPGSHTEEPDTRVITVKAPGMASPSGLEMDATKAPRKADRDLKQLHNFIRGCEASSTAVSRWEKSLGRPKYTAWRDTLIELGWARWKSENGTSAGWELVHPAEHILEAIELTDKAGDFT